MFMALAKLAQVVPASELLVRARRGGRWWRPGGWGWEGLGSHVLVGPLLCMVVHWAPCSHLARWVEAVGGPCRHQPRWSGGCVVLCAAELAAQPWMGAAFPFGSGGGGMSPGAGMSQIRWDGGPPAIRAADQLPAPLMDRPVMGPAQQGQIGQVGGAAMQPMPHMVGVAPGQGSGAVGEHTAAVTHRQGGALGGLDHSGGPADLQRLGRGATQDRGQVGDGGPRLEPDGSLGWWAIDC